MIDITAQLLSVVGGRQANRPDLDSIREGFREVKQSRDRVCAAEPDSVRCKDAKAWVAWYHKKFHF
jgi:hypothetical protein